MRLRPKKETTLERIQKYPFSACYVFPSICRNIKVKHKSIEEKFWFIVENLLKWNKEELCGSSRVAKVVYKRHVLMYVLVRNGVSTPKVGKILGGRDHSTVIHANKMINNYMETDPTKKAEIIAIDRQFYLELEN